MSGDGRPSKYLTGLMLAYRSNICLSATLTDLHPVPTGVSRGALKKTLTLLSTSMLWLGILVPKYFSAFSPSTTSYQTTSLDPP